MRIQSRIRIQLKILMQIRIRGGGEGGRSAKNVHPPWQNPRSARLHQIKILIHINVMRIHNTAPRNDDPVSFFDYYRRQRSAPFKSEATGSSPRDPETFLLKQNYRGLEPDPKWAKERKHQCCGSMTFWCGSGSDFGSADPCLLLMDPDPAILIIDLQDANKKIIFFKVCHKTVEIKVFLTIFAYW